MNQTLMPAPPARVPGPRLGTSFAVIGLGLAIAIASVIAIVIPLIGSFTSTVYTVPRDIRVHLRHAHYTVYQRTGTRSGFRTTSIDAIKIDPASVTVVAPHGLVVPVSFDPDVETITRGSAIYSGSLVFNAPVGGQYVLKFSNANTTTVVVARSIRDAIHSVLVWFATGALGTGVLIAGITMLIVGATRRGRAKRAMPAGWAQPPQWGGPPPQWGPAPAPAPPPDPWAPPPG